MSTTTLHNLLSRDGGENSIMQTITIAVSAILIAAGLVTAPGLINNARDNNARIDLANLAYAQELYAAGYDGDINFTSGGAPEYLAALLPGAASEPLTWASGDGRYALTFEELFEEGGSAVTLGGGVQHAMTVSPDGRQYLMAAESQSGNIFYRSSGSARTSDDISDIETHGLVVPVPVDIFAEPFVPAPPAPTYLSMNAALATSGVPGIILTVDPSAYIESSMPTPVVHACSTATRCDNPVETTTYQFNFDNEIRVELGEVEPGATVHFWVEGVLVGPGVATAERFDTDLVQFTRDDITITNARFTGAGDVAFDYSYFRHEGNLEVRVCNSSPTTGCVSIWNSDHNSAPVGSVHSTSLTTPSYQRSLITGNPVWVRVTFLTPHGYAYEETVQVSR